MNKPATGGRGNRNPKEGKSSRPPAKPVQERGNGRGVVIDGTSLDNGMVEAFVHLLGSIVTVKVRARLQFVSLFTLKIFFVLGEQHFTYLIDFESCAKLRFLSVVLGLLALTVYTSTT